MDSGSRAIHGQRNYSLCRQLARHTRALTLESSQGGRTYFQLILTVNCALVPHDTLYSIGRSRGVPHGLRQALPPETFSGSPNDRELSLPKMLSGANAFEISDIQEGETEAVVT